VAGGGAEAGPAVLCYDGSEEARHAIEESARLLGRGRALVLHVWESATTTFAYRYSAAGAVDPLGAALPELEEAAEQAARELAEEGAELARSAGFAAEPLALKTDTHLWSSIVHVAEQRQAAVVVVGSRGLGPVSSVVLGGVSNGVAHHCLRPVLIVPRRAPLLRVDDPLVEAPGAPLLVAVHELPTPGPGGD
jgi:nucleotide-binding universal stress UspA family protein